MRAALAGRVGAAAPPSGARTPVRRAGGLLLAVALATVAPAAAQEGAPGDTLEPAPVAPPAPPADTLSLAEALSTALGESPDVRSARATASAEGAARWADWGAFLPRASASMGMSRSDVRTVTFLSPEGFFAQLPRPEEDVNKGVTQVLSLNWTVLEGGRRIADMKAGAAAVDATRLRLSEAERQTVAEVKRAFFEARKQQRLVEIARSQLENRRRELERTRRRYRIAAVGRTDLLGARLAVRQAEVSLLEIRDAAKQARRELAVAMGVGTGTAPAAFALGDVPSPPEAGGLSADALTERTLATYPELRALEAEIDQASAQVWGARSRYLPTLEVGYSHNRSEQFTEQGDLFTFDPANRTNRLTISASLQLFSGFRRKEENARASAELQRARAQRARRRLEIEKTVRDLVDEVERRSRQVDLLQDQLEVAEERLTLLREQYRLGAAAFDELQRAIDDLTRYERDLARARYDYLDAWARLERWAGDVAPGLPGPETGGEAAPEGQGAGDTP